VVAEASGNNLSTTSDPKIVDATYNFQASDVGSFLSIMGSSNGLWTPGLYRIVSVASGNATLDRAPGPASTSGGYWVVGMEGSKCRNGVVSSKSAGGDQSKICTDLAVGVNSIVGCVERGVYLLETYRGTVSGNAVNCEVIADQATVSVNPSFGAINFSLSRFSVAVANTVECASVFPHGIVSADSDPYVVAGNFVSDYRSSAIRATIAEDEISEPISVTGNVGISSITSNPLISTSIGSGAVLSDTVMVLGNPTVPNYLDYANTVGMYVGGVGSPNEAVTASPGSLYLSTSGGTDTTGYLKTSGIGNTGWQAIDNV
jgi:hypothetical protein